MVLTDQRDLDVDHRGTIDDIHQVCHKATAGDTAGTARIDG